MMKGSIQEEDIIVNICAPNIGTLKCIEQILVDIKRENKSNNKLRRKRYVNNRFFTISPKVI